MRTISCVATLAFVCCGFTVAAQPVLSIDVNDRGSDIGTLTEPGFQSFVATGSGAISTPSSSAYDGITVTVATAEPGVNYDDRLRNTPAAAGDFTQTLLLRDFIFSAGSGLDITVEGLVANQLYRVKIWSYDSGSTAGGTRVSDWFANGALVYENYAMNGSVTPINNTHFMLSFDVSANDNGQILIQGRRDAITGSNPGVFLNALQIEPSQPEPPVVTSPPASVTAYAGESALFEVQFTGTAPFVFQWLKDGTPLAEATNRVLILTNVQAANAGAYSLTITNDSGGTASEAATLTVSPVANIRTALLAHWPLDEIDPTSPDLSGNGNDLIYTNLTAAQVVPGQRGQAVQFDGTGAMLYREHTDSTGLPVYPHTAYTVALWVKGSFLNQSDRRVFAEASQVTNSTLVSLGTHSSGTDGTVDVFVRNDLNATLLNHRRSSLIAFDDVWHHIAWVDDKGLGRLYVDGVLDTNDFRYPRGTLTPTATAVGGLLRAAPSHWFAGLIDDVAVWGRALTGSEVLQVMTYGPELTNVDPLRIERIESVSGFVVLSIVTPLPALPHRIHETSDLGSPQWTEVTGAMFDLTGNTITATFAAPSAGQRFYRVSY